MRYLELLNTMTDADKAELLAGLQGMQGIGGHRDGMRLQGHLRVTDADGNLLTEGNNMVMQDAFEALVSGLHSGGGISGFKYVGVGTTSTASTSALTALAAEVAGGSYARLVGAQGEGATARQYRVSGTWTNNSAGSQTVVEYGLFNASTVGTMFARFSKSDTSGPAAKTVAVSETIGITWTFTLS